MMATVSIQEAQAKLSELIHQLMPGEEVVITENNQPVTRLTAATLWEFAIKVDLRKLVLSQPF